jgi:hypothetical protein
MKPRFLKFALVCALLLSCTESITAGHDVSASELARHLKISVWRIQEKNLPPKFTVWIGRVQNGKLTKAYTAGAVFTRDGDLVVLAQKTDRGLAVSISCGGFSTSKPAASLEPIEYSMVHMLGTDAGIGTHVLCGDYPEKNGTRSATGKIEDLESGLVLQISE